jgi:probable rRNA maturation factor
MEDILGSNYELSLTFIGETRARTLNQQLRGKDYTPNVLSFPLSKHMGEIYICPGVAEIEASKFAMTPSRYIIFLFIHGCLHLKGYDHGATMDSLESKYIKKYRLA